MDDEDQPSVMAIDPGSRRCGVAVVRMDGTALFRAISLSDEIQGLADQLITKYRPTALLIGDGTGCEETECCLRLLSRGIPVYRVDESRSSEAARKRFIEEHRATGWQRFLPHSLRTPQRPYDDYAAQILAERWWKARSV